MKYVYAWIRLVSSTAFPLSIYRVLHFNMTWSASERVRDVVSPARIRSRMAVEFPGVFCSRLVWKTHRPAVLRWFNFIGTCSRHWQLEGWQNSKEIVKGAARTGVGSPALAPRRWRSMKEMVSDDGDERREIARGRRNG